MKCFVVFHIFALAVQWLCPWSTGPAIMTRAYEYVRVWLSLLCGSITHSRKMGSHYCIPGSKLDILRIKKRSSLFSFWLCTTRPLDTNISFIFLICLSSFLLFLFLFRPHSISLFFLSADKTGLYYHRPGSTVHCTDEVFNPLFFLYDLHHII